MNVFPLSNHQKSLLLRNRNFSVIFVKKTNQTQVFNLFWDRFELDKQTITPYKQAGMIRTHRNLTEMPKRSSRKPTVVCVRF